MANRQQIRNGSEATVRIYTSDASEAPFQRGSNAVRLGWREWAVVALMGLALLYLFPHAWPITRTADRAGWGHPEPQRDYRLPSEMSEDYWLFTQWLQASGRRYPAVVLGDSVVWGQYTSKEETLPHYLNELAGQDLFANLGIDGLHPAAMAGLVRYFGRALRNKAVLVHLNPLWMSSEKHDLQVQEEFRFNHPRLLPQLFPNLACYNPSLTEIMGAVAERYVPFFGWKNHLKTAYLGGLGLQEWTLENPYKNPFNSENWPEVPRDEGPKSEPISWRARGITPENFPWVAVEGSFQWKSFESVLTILKSRKNDVFVLLGPFNAHMLTPESRTRYQAVKQEMERRLEGKGISFHSASLLPSEHYADASHPLAEGYREVAEELFQSPAFRTWLENFAGSRAEGRGSRFRTRHLSKGTDEMGRVKCLLMPLPIRQLIGVHLTLEGRPSVSRISSRSWQSSP